MGKMAKAKAKSSKKSLKGRVSRKPSPVKIRFKSTASRRSDVVRSGRPPKVLSDDDAVDADAGVSEDAVDKDVSGVKDDGPDAKLSVSEFEAKLSKYESESIGEESSVPATGQERVQKPTKVPLELKCPECGSTSLITDYKHGEVVCKKCGLVTEDAIFDFGPEWRAFDEEQKSKRARTGGPVKFAKLNKGLTTEIDRYDRDIRGGAIQPERKAQLYRLRKWQRRSRMSDSVQRNLSIALPELDRMCAYLNIPNNIKEECAMWYRKAVSKGLVRGRSIESVVAAIIYLISRKHQLPKTLEELADASGVKKKDIGRSYRFACRRLNIRMPVATPMDYVPRFASELGLSGETEAKAIEILKKAREKGVTSGRGPTGVAAAAIYLAGKLTNDKQTQKGIAGRLAGVTEVTIRNRYEEIARELGIEV